MGPFPLSRRLFTISILAATLSLVCLGCTRMIEIPDGHVGVVIEGDRVKRDVLLPGKHEVDLKWHVVTYPTRQIFIEQEFDILFFDSSGGMLTVQAQYYPIADSLPSLFEKYQQPNIQFLLEYLTRSAVRKTALALPPTTLTITDTKRKLLQAILHDREIRRYAHIKRIKISKLTLRPNGTVK